MTSILSTGRRRASVPILFATILVGGIWAGLSAQTAGRQFYAAPTGLPTNDGSIASPLDLTKALSTTGPLRPGDTLWLRGGRYVGNFTSSLTGTASQPIVVRQYPGERATLDAATANPSLPGLRVDGADTWYWGFEVTDTSAARAQAVFNNPPLRATSVDVFGPRTRFINMIVHDGLQGFGFWSPAVDAEIYGSLVYNVGVEADDRGHGHLIYVQNASGLKRIVDNVMFNSFSFGIHAYTSGGRVDNLHIEGNTVVGAGVLSPGSGAKANIMTGGGDVADNNRVLNNVVFYPYYATYPQIAGRGLDLGYGLGCSNPEIRGNYAVADQPVLIARCTNVTMSGNTFFRHHPDPVSTQFPNNTYHSTAPTGVRTFVRPNAYEPGRAHITIVNWDLAPTVQVDLAPAGLAVGTPFEIRDAMNFFATPAVTGTYAGGTVSVPMTGRTAAAPIGNAPIVPAHTAPQFGAFVLLPTGVATPPPPAPPTPPAPPAPPTPPTPPAPPAAPRIDGVSPSSGQSLGGLTVTLTGAGFASPAAVLVGGTPASAVVVPNSSTLSMIVPAHAPGVVDIVVSTAGSQAVRPSAFTYEPMAPVLHPVAISGNQVSLQWQAGPGTPVRAYGVVAGQVPGANHFGPYLLGLGNALSATVAPGTYYARVLADTAWGLLTSNEVGFTVGLPGLPSPPTLAPASISGQTVSLAWTAVAGSGGYVVVARSTAAGPPIATLPVAGTALSVAAPLGVYLVSVVAVNGYGVGAESNQIVVNVP